MNNPAICITAGEQSENHIGMKINGKGLASSGFSIKELNDFKIRLQEKRIESEYYQLDDVLEGEDKEDVEPAAILIIRNAISKIINETPEDMLKEQLSYEWDKNYWDTRRQKVLNLRARYNVCYGATARTPDYENKKGTIIAYDNVPILNKWRDSLGMLFGEKAKELEVEGNLYYDTKKCGIGFHGDAERKKVIACSLGASRPIHWQWYYKSNPIGDRIKFTLHSGDMYVMSEKASGYDFKRSRTIKVLKHAAGEKYIK